MARLQAAVAAHVKGCRGLLGDTDWIVELVPQRRYAYTVGLTRLNLPELVMARTDLRFAATVLNLVAEQLRDGSARVGDNVAVVVDDGERVTRMRPYRPAGEDRELRTARALFGELVEAVELY